MTSCGYGLAGMNTNRIELGCSLHGAGFAKLRRTSKLTALPGAETNLKHTDSMAKKSTSKTPSAPAVDRAAPRSSDFAFLILEAENMALTLESLGMGRHVGGQMCTPVERYRARFPRKTNMNYPKGHSA